MLLSLFKKNDAILILGVSGCVFLPILKLFSSAKIITNIDGLEWRRNKWNKPAKCFLKFSEKIAVKYSDVIISDNKAIADYVLSEYNIISETIAYGGDHAIIKNSEPNINKNYFFTVCRIEPENNIDIILKAFSKSKSNLKIVGNWASSLYGKRLKETYASFQNIECLEPIYDINILFKLRSECIGYIHGHSAGGTNPSLVEAMHFCKPILAFDCSFNRYTTENSAMYFKNANDLCELLSNISNGIFTEEIEKSTSLMKKIAMQKYTWVNITKMYEKLY